jgi:hypothetical protein
MMGVSSGDTVRCRGLICTYLSEGRAMVQALSRRPLATDARFRSLFSPCEVYVGPSERETGFSPCTSGLPCQDHSRIAPY